MSHMGNKQQPPAPQRTSERKDEPQRSLSPARPHPPVSGGTPPVRNGNSMPGNGRPGRIMLPFEKRKKGDVGDWVYRHRVGLLVTAILYLLGGILFFSYKIVVYQNPASIMYVDLEDPDQIEQLTPEEREKLFEEMMNQYDDPAKNRLSNENSAENNTYNRPRNEQNSRIDQINEEARRVQEQLNAGQQAYEAGMNEVEAIKNKPKDSKTDKDKNRKDRENDSQNSNTKVQGNVTVRVDLAGRIVTSWYVPAYQCRGGGTVIVGVTVNRNGEVIQAAVNNITLGAETCIAERAVQAAYATLFNADASAPEKQKGTISYTFVAQ